MAELSLKRGKPVNIELAFYGGNLCIGPWFPQSWVPGHREGKAELCALPRDSTWKAKTPTLGLSRHPDRLQVLVDFLVRQGLLHVSVFLGPITARGGQQPLEFRDHGIIAPGSLQPNSSCWMTNQCEWPLRRGPTGEQPLCWSGMRSPAVLMSISAYYSVSGVALTWECLFHFPPLPKLLFLFKACREIAVGS